eukprot:1181819-Prorocentrum_minimum.AAC.8
MDMGGGGGRLVLFTVAPGAPSPLKKFEATSISPRLNLSALLEPLFLGEFLLILFDFGTVLVSIHLSGGKPNAPFQPCDRVG